MRRGKKKKKDGLDAQERRKKRRSKDAQMKEKKRNGSRISTIYISENIYKNATAYSKCAIKYKQSVYVQGGVK